MKIKKHTNYKSTIDLSNFSINFESGGLFVVDAVLWDRVVVREIREHEPSLSVAMPISTFMACFEEVEA